MERSTIIIGAGASIEFVKHPRLTSGLIMQKLLDVNSWNNLLNKYLIDTQSELNVEYILDLINKIKKANDNFEDLIEIIDKVCTLLNPHKFSDALLISSVNYITKQSLENSSDRFELLNVPLYIRELIAEIVREYNEDLGKDNSGQTLLELQKNFIECLLEKCKRVSIHSLNYDDCILKSLSSLGFCTGFDNSGHFQKSEYQSSNRVISFLHGTPHFVPKFKYFSGNSAVVKYYDDCEEASNKRWRLSRTHPGLYTDGIVHPDYNHFITTGRTKDIHFYNQPYASYYTRLAEDLDNADLIFIIGYSFGDEHINQLLSSIRDDEYPRSIVIVDFDDCNNENHEDGIRKKIIKIIITLEKHYTESSAALSYSNILSQLREKKYAKIGCHDIYYYNKGYASFLNEDIKDLIFKEFATFIA